MKMKRREVVSHGILIPSLSGRMELKSESEGGKGSFLSGAKVEDIINTERVTDSR